MFHIIANPVSGKKNGTKAIKKLEAYLKENNIPYELAVTAEVGHATEIAKELCAKGVESIIAVGGDGTFNEIVNGITDFDQVTLGFIPAGNGNDFARIAKLSKNPVKAFQDIQKNLVRKIDFYEINGQLRGLNVAGTGLDIEVLLRFNKAKWIKGKLGYLFALVKALINFQPYKIKVRVGEEESIHECIMVGVCNGASIGGGMKLSPRSSLFDHKLNLVIDHMLKRYKIPHTLPSFLNGKHIDKYFAEERLVDAVEIEMIYEKDPKGKNVTSQRELHIDVDGQVIQNMPFKVKVIPDQLKIYCSEALYQQ